MPSSLIFAALAVAWLVVLVPMVAKRRQEVVRLADSALAARVLRRPAPGKHGEEVSGMTDRTVPRERGAGETARPEPPERRFRPGRGGYDPDAAALAAQARYAYRQRAVAGLLIAAVGTALLAIFVSATSWWIHAGLDVLLIGYLAYLRRQVRIEEEVRRRRAARMAAARLRPSPPAEQDEAGIAAQDQAGIAKPTAPQPEAAEPLAAAEPAAPAARPAAEPAAPVSRPPAPPPVHPSAVAVDLDDEDPAFEELDPSFQPPYRRAVGE